MLRKISIFGISFFFILLTFSGCFEGESKSKLEMNIDIDSSDFPVKLIVISIDSDKNYNWNKVNISLTSQFTDPVFIDKEGIIKTNDIIEIPDYVFNDISKVFVRIKLNTSSVLIWGDTVYAPNPTPNISFDINESKIIVKSIDKIDYDWDLNLTIINESFIITDHLFDKYKQIELEDFIDLYNYEIYEELEVEVVYNPTNEVIGDFTLNLVEPDPEIFLKVHEISVDSLVFSTYFYIYSTKNTKGTQIINWEITPDLPSWLILSPMSGNFSYGSYKIFINISSSDLSVGEYNHKIKIVSNYGNEEFDIILTKIE